MNKQMFSCFLLSFFIPMVYQRGKFLLSEKSFYKIALREKSRLQIHHGHWGIAILFVTTMLSLYQGGINLISTSLFGLGWGLLLDELIPSLTMPSKDRALELSVYGRSFWKTQTLFLFVIALVGGLYYLGGK